MIDSRCTNGFCSTELVPCILSALHGGEAGCQEYPMPDFWDTSVHH